MFLPSPSGWPPASSPTLSHDQASRVEPSSRSEHRAASALAVASCRLHRLLNSVSAVFLRIFTSMFPGTPGRWLPFLSRTASVRCCFLGKSGLVCGCCFAGLGSAATPSGFWRDLGKTGVCPSSRVGRLRQGRRLVLGLCADRSLAPLRSPCRACAQAHAPVPLRSVWQGVCFWKSVRSTWRLSGGWCLSVPRGLRASAGSAVTLASFLYWKFITSLFFLHLIYQRFVSVINLFKEPALCFVDFFLVFLFNYTDFCSCCCILQF